MRRPKLIVALAVACLAGVLAVVLWLSRCPIELRLSSVEPIEVVGADGTNLFLAYFTVTNRENASLVFDQNAKAEARIANHWLAVTSFWTFHSVIPAGKGSGSYELMVLVPAGADACRFRPRFFLDRKLPLGIGDPWARYSPPSRFALRVQKATVSVSRRLYDWLWPTSSAGRTPHWRTTTVEVAFPQTITHLAQFSGPAKVRLRTTSSAIDSASNAKLSLNDEPAPEHLSFSLPLSR